MPPRSIPPYQLRSMTWTRGDKVLRGKIGIGPIEIDLPWLSNELVMREMEARFSRFRGNIRLPSQEFNLGRFGRGEIGGLGRARERFGRKAPLAAGERRTKPPGKIKKEPIIDVFTEDHKIEVITELPGIKKEDIDLKIEGRMLKLYASNYYREYHTEVELPCEVRDEVNKELKNGILTAIFTKR